MSKFLWDSLFPKYKKSVLNDINADFAYERLVNSLSILSLCNNTGYALDLGCGDGRFTRELEARYQKVVAVDLSSKMLVQAKKVCKNTKFIKLDLEKKFPQLNLSFDLVTCKLVLMYLNNIDNLAREAYKVLNKNGILVISVTHPIKWLEKNTYLNEISVAGNIAKDNNLSVVFRARTLQTYVNTFTKYGFKVDAILETGVPDSFVIKYPDYLPYQNKPYRLNVRFIKI